MILVILNGANVSLFILIKLGVHKVERKIMHKSKGRWVVLSSSLLLSALALNLATPVAQAEELTDDSVVIAEEGETTAAPVETSAPLTETEAELVDQIVDELVSEVISTDEAIAADETISTQTTEVAVQAPAVFATLRVATGTHTR